MRWLKTCQGHARQSHTTTMPKQKDTLQVVKIRHSISVIQSRSDVNILFAETKLRASKPSTI